MATRVDLIRQCLTTLSSSPEEQVAYLSTLGVDVDELALEFDDATLPTAAMLRSGELNSEQGHCIARLNERLEAMSGHGNKRLWTTEALRSAPEWTHVRALARECLEILQCS